MSTINLSLTKMYICVSLYSELKSHNRLKCYYCKSLSDFKKLYRIHDLVMGILTNFKLRSLIHGFEGAEATVELFYEKNYHSLEP
jgi:hypothetical protein